MTIHASTLDIEKLHKVRTLMDGGKTEGERKAARNKATTIAARAGLTLKAALSRLDAQAKAQASTPFTAKNPFQDFGDWMEAKEPGWKAREAERRATKEAKRLARCKELLTLYDSEDAVFESTPLEAALRAALGYLEEPRNTLWGYKDFRYIDGPTPEMWDAMRGTGLVPDTLPKVWEAFEAHEARIDARCTFDPDYTSWQWEEAWRSALEWLLNRLHCPTVEGIAARLDWMEHLASRGMARSEDADQALIAALRADFTAFAASKVVQSAGSPNATSSATCRRAEVRSLLATAPDLSDREIARRVGCSPQTVGNWRRRLAQEGE